MRRTFRYQLLAPAWTATVLVMAATPWLAAQTTSPSPDGSAPPPQTEAAVPLVELDIEALLASPDVISKGTEGSVWTVVPRPIRQRPTPRRRPSKRPNVRPRSIDSLVPRAIARRPNSAEPRLLLLPLRLIAPAQPATLDASTVRVKGGRFVAWKLSDKSQPASSEYRADAPADGVPMFARKVVVESAALRWRVERKIPGGELKATQSGYDLKINPKRIVTVTFNAGAPPPKPTGEVTRESRKQWRDGVAAYNRTTAQIRKQNAAQIREMTQQVAALPNEFAMAMPQRIWAVFDIGSPRGELVLDIPETPLWRIAYDHLTAIRQATGGSRRVDVGSVSAAQAMAGVASRRDAMNQRFVAVALAGSKLISQVRVNDEMYHVVEKMISSPDDAARQTVIDELLETPPTRATNRLVAAAVPHLDAGQKLQWLRVTLEASMHGGAGRAITAQDFQNVPAALNRRIQLVPPVHPAQIPAGADPGGRGAALAHGRDESPAAGHADTPLAVITANRLLQDPEGPQPLAIVKLLNQHPNGGAGSNSLMADGLRFDLLEGQRRDRTIAAVVRYAGSSPLAAHWLDRHLIGDGAGRDLQRQTIRTLAGAYGWHNAFSVGYERMADAMFGHADGADPVAAVRVDALIEINSAKHGLFNALLHGDTEIRELAWRALPQFALPRSAEQYSGGRSTDEQSQVLATLLSVARGQREPRPQIVEFLRCQTDLSQSTWALVLLAAEGGPGLSTTAGHALIGSGRPIGEVLARHALSPDQLHGFARSVYGGDAAPLVTGLIRTDYAERSIARWFADRVSAGQVPAPADWGPQYGRRVDVVAAVASSDQKLAAAAAAALAASAGADDEQVPRIVKAIRDAGDSQDDQMAKWDELRSEINGLRMQEAAGPYMLALKIYPQPEVTQLRPAQPLHMPLPGAHYDDDWLDREKGLEPPADLAPQIDRELGIVHLTVEGSTVYLGNQTVTASIPDDRLAIEIENPDELKNLVDDLAKLQFEEDATIKLNSYQQQDWRSVFTLRDQRVAVLLLRRVVK